MRNRTILFVVLCVTFGLGAAAGQVKLAEIPGTPGAFNTSTGVAFLGLRNWAFASNPGSGVILKFRPATGEILGSTPRPPDAQALPPGSGPLAIDSDGSTLVVANTINHRIYMIDPNTMKTRLETGYEKASFNGRCNIVFSREGSAFFIADPAQNAVAAFIKLTGALYSLVPVGINPTIIAVNPNPVPLGSSQNKRDLAVLCSGNAADDEESVYFLDSLQIRVSDLFKNQAVKFNAEPFNNLSFDPTGSYLYAVAYNSDRIIVYDLRNYYPNVFESKGISATGSKATGPTKIAVSPSGAYLAVMHAGSKSISILQSNYYLKQEVIIPDLDFSPDSTVCFSKDNTTLYIPSLSRGEVISYNMQDFAIRRRIAVGRQPTMLQLSPDDKSLVSVDVGSPGDLSLIAVNPITLYIPHLIQNSKDYAGVALANFGTETTSVALAARNNTGALIPGTQNPRLIAIEPNKQMSLVPAQMFGLNSNEELDGYIEANMLTANVSVLYLTGNVSQTQLDGFVADGATTKQLGFGRITEGMTRFGSQTSTEIALLNPGDQIANLTLRMFYRTLSGPGTLIGYYNRALPAHSRVRQRIADLVPTSYYPLDKAYLEVNSDQLIKGLALVRIGDSLAILPAASRGGVDTSYSALQFVSGGSGTGDGTTYFSDVSLANTTTDPISVTMQVVDDKGKIIPSGAKPVVRTIDPGDTVSGGADALLKWPDPLVDPNRYEGLLTVEADKPGLIADMVYGEARNGRFLTSASLDPRKVSGTEFAFGYFVEGNFGDPSRGFQKRFYTGIVIFNPNRGMANLQVEARDPAGNLLAHANLHVEAQSRISQTIGQMMPEIKLPAVGTIRIKSDDLAVRLFGVFGSLTSDFLVAIPPIILTP